MGKAKKILCYITIMTLLALIPSFPVMATQKNYAKATNQDAEIIPALSTPTPTCSQYEPPPTPMREGDYEYFLTNDKSNIKIVEYVGTSSDVAIPLTIAGKNVVAIESYTFNGCNSVNTISISATVGFIGTSAFTKCSNLESINIDVNNSTYKSIDGVLFDKVNTILKYPEGRKTETYEIPDDVTKIHEFAFQSCTYLKTVIMPDSVEHISYGAFKESKSLTNVIISKNVQRLFNSTFFNCTNLSAITIPDGMISLTGQVFFNCINLESAIIPVSVTHIGYDVFDNCDKLVIYGVAGSYAYQYAYDHNISFVAVSSTVTPTPPSTVPDTPQPTVTPIPSPTVVTDTPQRTVTPTVVTDTPQPTVTPTPPSTVPGTLPPTATPAATPTAIPTTSTFVTKQPFPDLESTEWARSAIIFLAQANVINGYEDGTFRPKNDITRAEFAKMLVLAFDVYDQDAESSFSDVAKGQWYDSYIASAEKEELTEGTGNGNFSPDATITREEMLTFCARAVSKYKGIELLEKNSADIEEQLNTFADGNAVSEWAKPFVATVTKYGLVKGSLAGDNSFALNPHTPINRAEVAVVLERAMNIESDNIGSFGHFLYLHFSYKE